MGIVRSFHGEWIDCRGSYCFLLYNGLKVKCNGHFTFKSVIDSWGTRIVCIFAVTGLIAEAFLLLFFVVLCNGMNITENEV